jgi:hypothetical protein
MVATAVIRESSCSTRLSDSLRMGRHEAATRRRVVETAAGARAGEDKGLAASTMTGS